jgi:hypothetical protein
MKLYTFVAHYLKNVHEKYGCSPKFKRRDNSTYGRTDGRTYGRTDGRSGWFLYTPNVLCGGIAIKYRLNVICQFKASLCKFYGHQPDRYGIYVSQMTMDMYLLPKAPPTSFLNHDLSPVCNKINTTVATSGAGTIYPSRAPEWGSIG